MRFDTILKRAMDIMIAMMGALVCLPLLALTSLLIVMFMGRPIFFKQLRPGLNGVPFTIIKFRTMHNITDIQDNVKEDAERMTRFGMFLRSTSLDELPELWNVLKGEMSIVGPRPLLMEYLPLYSPEQARRHEVRPGITGWAQVNGRNLISWNEKFKYDVWYVDNQTFALDIKILFITLKRIILREGISADGEVTMYKFKGNQD